MNLADELMHPVGSHPAWSESYYFNFVDPDKNMGMFTRMAFRCNEGWADGLHVLFLGGNRLAFTYDHRLITPGDDELKVGGLRLERAESFKRWMVHYHGPAQDIPDGSILITPRKERPAGWYRQSDLSMSLAFITLAVGQSCS